MEALIHHFKLVTEGFRVPPGEVYYPIESPRGELGCFVRSDGSSKPARVHMRDPSFVNLQATRADGARALYIADLIATLAMLDPIARRDRSLMAIDPTRSSATARLARPRLGRGRRPDEGPGGRPRPRHDAGARRRCARRSRRAWRSTPTAARRRSRRCTPSSACTAGARRGRSSRPPCVMRADARVPDRRWRPSTTCSRRARRAATTSTCARTSRARCAAPTRCSRRSQEPRRRPGLQHPRVRVPRRVRHRADGVGRRRYVGPLELGEVPRRSSSRSDAARSRCPDKQLARRKPVDPGATLR